MRLIEGTVEEIVEYQRRMGQDATSAPHAEEPEEVGEATVARQAADASHDEDWYFIEQHVFARAKSAAVKSHVLDYLKRVLDFGTTAEVGESARTYDGLTDYIMVRDDGPRRFGAVAYVKPRNGGLTLRLGSEDIEDLQTDVVKLRQTKADNQYAVNCPLHSPEAVEVALDLTRRALEKVRR